MRSTVVLLAFALLAACGHRNDDVGGVTPDEDRQLNEAAAALDVNYTAPPDNEFIVVNDSAPGSTGNEQ
jgi:hypothetical protein